jgi:hypothetical protein
MPDYRAYLIGSDGHIFEAVAMRRLSQPPSSWLTDMMLSYGSVIAKSRNSSTKLASQGI